MKEFHSIEYGIEEWMHKLDDLQIGDGYMLDNGGTWYTWHNDMHDVFCRDNMRIRAIRKSDIKVDESLLRLGASLKVNLNNEINQPNHYTKGGIEVWDIMKAYLSKEEFIGYLKGNIIKYNLRAGHKEDELKDYKKAQAYLNKLLEELNEH